MTEITNEINPELLKDWIIELTNYSSKQVDMVILQIQQEQTIRKGKHN